MRVFPGIFSNISITIGIPCVAMPIQPYYLVFQKKNVMSQYTVIKMQYAKYTRMLYYIWLHFVACKPACFFFGYPSPTILCSAAEVKSPFRMSSIHPSIDLFIHPSTGGHGGGPPAEGQPEPKLLRPAQHLPADPRGQRAEPTGAAARGDPPVPHPILTRHPLDPAVCGLPGPRRT